MILNKTTNNLFSALATKFHSYIFTKRDCVLHLLSNQLQTMDGHFINWHVTMRTQCDECKCIQYLKQADNYQRNMYCSYKMLSIHSADRTLCLTH